MNKILFSYFLFLCPIIGFSQITTISGKIIIDDLSEPLDLSSILISNETSNAKTKSNNLGIFSIKVNVGDKLLFVSDFTENRIINMSDDIIKKGIVIVHLDLETIELAEANINPLKKNLKDNISKSASEKTNLYNSLGLDPNLQYIEVNPNMTSTINHNGWGQDPSLWIAALTGQRKRDVKKNEFFKTENKLSDLKDFFTENYFLENLKIPKHKIDEFIKFCYGNKALNLNKLIDGYRYLEIEQIFESEAPKYLKLLE